MLPINAFVTKSAAPCCVFIALPLSKKKARNGKNAVDSALPTLID